MPSHVVLSVGWAVLCCFHWGSYAQLPSAGRSAGGLLNLAGTLRFSSIGPFVPGFFMVWWSQGSIPKERQQINYTPYKIKTKANEQLKERAREQVPQGLLRPEHPRWSRLPLSVHLTMWQGGGVILQMRVHAEGGILSTSSANSLPQKQLTFLRLW